MSASPACVAPFELESEQSTAAKLTYRPDIDGLRAIAALSVLGIHVGLLPGGFIGVDIFFVISGFLISGIILRALARGSFSTFGFYARRAKRIFPAFLVVLIAVMGFGWLTLLPSEYEQLGREIAEGAGFVYDLSQYWRPNDGLHFDLSGIGLGHLWSLGVEEQFYLLWPMLLVLTFKLRKWRVALIATVTAISFVVNIALASRGHSAAYFVPLPRLWELSLGGTLAYLELERQRDARRARAISSGPLFRWSGLNNRHVRGFIGAALITVSLVEFDSIAFFPGWQALAPCIGTLLLIAAGPQSWMNRYVLGASPIVFIGLISYPVYLWHVPLLQILHVMWGDVTPAMTAGAVLATFVFAFLTYKYIELPIRSSARIAPIAGMLCAAMLACVTVGCMTYFRLIPARSEPLNVGIFLQATTEDWLPDTHNRSWTLASDKPLMLGAGPRRVLYVGDSNIQQYYPRIAKLLADHPQNSHSATFAVRDWCAPGAFEIAEIDDATRAVCRKFLRDAFEYAKDPAVDTVVIGGCWSCYFLNFDDLITDTAGQLTPGADRALDSLKRTIAELIGKGKRVYVVLSIPIGADFDPHQMVRRTILPPGFTIAVHSPSRSHVTSAVEPIVSRLRKIIEASGAIVIDPLLSLCNQTTCPSVSPTGQPMYHDWWNLSPSYVRDNIRFLDNTVLDVDVDRVVDPVHVQTLPIP
jgi:peptidoglycan/LPS O-acetylase OafA/YrhL